MASLAAQDRYLQGLARRAGVRHSPERPQPRKRKPGEGWGGLERDVEAPRGGLRGAGAGGAGLGLVPEQGRCGGPSCELGWCALLCESLVCVQPYTG